MAINATLANRRNSSRQRIRQQAPAEIEESTRDRQQLVQATRDLGGNTKPAYVSNATIPTLERNFTQSYEQTAPKPTLGRLAGAMMGAVLQNPNAQTAQAARTANNNYAAAQRNNQLYNDIKADEVEQTLNRLGQTNIARKPNEQFVESIKSHGGSINPFDYENFWDFQAHSPIGGAALLDVLSAESHKFERQNLTPEMARAGLTERDLEVWNNARNAEERQRVLSQWAKEHPVISTLRAFPENLGESLENVSNAVGSYVTGTPIESRPTRAEIYRNAVNEGIDSKVGRMAYGAVNSVGDMALAALAGNPILSAGAMGAEKASDTVNSAVERGLDPNQIMAEGILSGVSTALTEMVPFKGFKNGNSILKGMVSEGLQEGLEDLADTSFDQIVTLLGGNHDKSELSQTYNAYRQMGMSDADALIQTAKDYAGQLGTDIVLGGITGGLMQGGSNAIRGRDIFSGNLNQAAQNQILNDVKAQSEEVLSNLTAENYNAFTQNVENLKEQLPELKNGLDKVNEEVNNTVLDSIKTVGDMLLENPNADALADFTQNVEQIKQQIPSLGQDIDNIVADFNKKYEDATTQANVKTNVDNVIPRVDNVNSNVDINVQQYIQPEVKVPEIRASRVDLSNARRTTDGLREKLDYFSSEVDTQPLMNELNEAYDRVVNSRGQAQIDAIQNLNTVANRINETMRGTTIGQSARDINEEGYNNVRNVTDGRRIAITPAQLESTGYRTLRELNSAAYTGSPKSVKFYAEGALNTVPLDNVYAEMRDLSNGELPDVTEGDQLNALVNYITQYKSGKNDTVELANWDRMNTDSRTDSERRVDDIADTVLDSIDDGDVTAEQMAQVFNMLSEIQSKNPELAGKISQVQQGLLGAWQLNANLPTDIKAIKNPAQAQQALDEEVKKLDRVLSMNLEMFSESEGETPKANDRELHTGVYKDSKLSTNSYPRSGIMTDAEMTQNLSDENKQYEAVTHEGTYNKATENLKRNGYTNELKDLMNRKGWDAVDVDEAMLCSMRAVEDARNAEARGVDSKQAWKKAVDLFVKMREEATRGGQAIEALKKWSAKTPEGKLGQAIAYAKDEQKSGVDNAWMKELKNVQDTNNTVFTKEFIEAFLKKAHQYDNQTPTIAQEERLNQELAHMVLDQIPKKFKDKFTSLWIDNLLASIRTLFTRNTGGNAGKFALDQTITKVFSGPIDEFASKLTGTRTTTGFTREGFKTAMSGLREGALNTARDYWAANADPEKIKKFRDIVKEFDLFADANVSNRPGEEGNFRETLKNNRNAFESKAFKLYDKFIKFGLAFSDNPFYTAVYNQTLQELNTLKENGRLKLPENVSDEKFEQWAKSYAYAQALEAVYQNDTALSNGAMRIKQGLGEMSEGYLGVDILSGASMPFVRTPMNVILTNLEYSPLGVVKNAIYTLREINNNLKNNRSAFDLQSFNQSRFVRETSRNLVGILMFGIGLAMKNAGLLTGGYSDNEKEKQAQKEAGMQEYAFVNPFNGNQWSINWIPAVGSDLVMAAAYDDAFKKPEQTTLQALTNGIKEGSASMFEMAALQGLQRLTGSANYNSDNSIIDNAAQTVANTASSAIVPSFVRQMAAAMDPYKRNTYGAGGYESIMNNAISGIPFLRETLQPRIGSNGQPLEQNAGRNVFQKWMDNLVNPAMVTVPSAVNDPVRNEAQRLFNETRNYDAFQPKIGMDFLKVEDHIPTTEEYTEFLQIANTAMNQTALEFINSDFYNSLTDEQKEATLKDIYTAVKSVERSNFLELESDFNGAAQAYNDGGTQGLIDYYKAKTALTDFEAYNNPQNREQILNVLENGGEDTLQQMQELGFDMNLIKKYNHAADRIPSLDPVTFEQQFHSIDQQKPGESGYGSIKQSEIIDYLNQNPTYYNNESAYQIWDAYLQSYSKIPTLNPETGLWEAK